MKERQERLRNEHGLFRNEDGAIDLASIMVGVIVIGLIGGVIAATVFAVIPWTQDNAAKQQLESVVAAQSAYKGLSSGVPPATPAGHAPNSYASSAQLEEANMLKTSDRYCTVTIEDGAGYIAFTKSDAGKIWAATNKNTKPVIHTGTLPTDCAFLAVSDPNDIDGDGIPNAEDRDADGDGMQDNYVPGGPIATLQGTPTPSTGTYNSVTLTGSSTVISSNVTVPSESVGRKISMHLVVACVKEDGSFYKRNYLSSWTPTSSTTTNLQTVPCATGERLDEYTVKPVTQEALDSGELSNRDSYGGWTFRFADPAAGGYRWSEPDGYITGGNLVSSYVSGGGSLVYATFKNDVTASRVLSAQYTMVCERPDKTTYKMNRIISYTSRSGWIEETTVTLNRCGTDRITAYDIFPVTKLGAVENRESFDTYSMTGSTSWTEERDGYQKSGTFISSYVGDGGSNVYATVKNEVTASRTLALQYKMLCERADRSTYPTNRLATYTSRSGWIEETVIKLTACGADRILSYEIAPVTRLGDVANRESFGGYTMTGSTSWTEERDGYLTGGRYLSSYVGSGGSTLFVTVENAVTASRTLATHYTMTCERDDKTSYAVSRLATYTSRSGWIEQTVLSITGCGTDRITAYGIAPVTDLGKVENRSAFAGYSISGGASWKESDGYQRSGTLLSSYVGNGGSTVYATVKNEVTASLTLALQYTMRCIKDNKESYDVNRLATYTSRSGWVEETLMSISGCGTDRIIAYKIFPVTSLGDVANRSAFAGYSMTGENSWAEANGYQTSGNYVSSFVTSGGSVVSVTFKNAVTASRTLASQYTLTCERADKSTYSMKRILTYTSRSGWIEETTVTLTNCGTDRVIGYSFAPVTTLGEVENREAFVGYSMSGGTNWTEANGYQTSGNYVSSYISGTTVYATFRNAVTASRTLASQYTLTCERADKSTYSMKRLVTYTSRSGWIENTTVTLTGCGTDRVSGYSFAPVTTLGEVENREAFAGYSMSGSYSWSG